jgi:hypothetical protein
MVNISGASAAGTQSQWASWIGYAACGWALLFSLMHMDHMDNNNMKTTVLRRSGCLHP